MLFKLKFKKYKRSRAAHFTCHLSTNPATI